MKTGYGPSPLAEVLRLCELERLALAFCFRAFMSEPFDSAKYRRQNQKYGALLRWWKAWPCECVDVVTGERDAACPDCEKDGRVYIEQTIPNGIDGLPLRALVIETAIEVNDEEFGLIEVGQTGISVNPSELPLSRGDRVSILDAQFAIVGRQTIKRASSGDFDALGQGGVAALVIVSQNNVAYTPGTQFTLNADRVQWLGATRPAAGTRYSVEFRTYPQFTCLHLPTQLRGSSSDGAGLPQDWVLVRR